MAGVIQSEGHNPYPVAATGFLLGSQVTLVLYGVHICQISRYYIRFGKTDKKKYSWVVVPAVFGLSSIHIGMIAFSAHHYFVKGIAQKYIWDTFYGGLSGQDFIIPMISYVSHLFFGHRIYILRNFKLRYWIGFVSFATLTCIIGIIFAALARVWSMHPFQTQEEFEAMSIGPVADAFPTVWLTCAAAIDGGLTATLIYTLLKERQFHKHTRQLLYEIAGLTLETVLLTHVIGATLFVLWLTSRTRTNAFWFFIEIIAECYALSVLFTLNSRNRFRRTAQPNTQSMIDRQLHRLEGESSNLQMNSIVHNITLVRDHGVSVDEITQVQWLDSTDPEKGEYPPQNQPKEDHNKDTKSRSQSISSFQSSDDKTGPGALPT